MIDVKQIQKRASETFKNLQEETQKPYYRRVMEMMLFLGLLRNKKYQPCRHILALGDYLRAGKIEPRILEVLPALVLNAPEAIDLKKTPIPEDLKEVLMALKDVSEEGLPTYRGIAPEKYLHWCDPKHFVLAKKKINYRKRPRKVRTEKTKELDDIAIDTRNARLALVLTREEFARTFDIPVSVLRKIEAGDSDDVKLKDLKKVIEAIGKELKIA
jgi:DNA-binding transcriptional regulator YiaG